MLKILSAQLQKDESGSVQTLKLPSISKLLSVDCVDEKITLSFLGDEDFVGHDALYRVFKSNSVMPNEIADAGFLGSVVMADGLYLVFEGGQTRAGRI